jgi:hypothetical protein
MIGNAIVEIDMADRFCPLFRVRYSVAGGPGDSGTAAHDLAWHDEEKQWLIATLRGHSHATW